jgi:digeranylgeranylglycerophospholipid reductase
MYLFDKGKASCMEAFDITVIGAGPSGSIAAKHAAKSGLRVALIEEHKSVGWPLECAGLLGMKAIEQSEINLSKVKVREFRGATIFTPQSCASFKACNSKAWAIDRKLFDRALALEAVKHGAELRLGTSVRGLSREGQLSTLALSDSEEISSRIVISAEGVRSRIARQAGIDPPRVMLSGAQVEVPIQIEDPEKVELHLSQKIAPGLFAWVIPVRSGFARIGLCARDNALMRLESFLRSEAISKRLEGSPLDLVVGGLPLSVPKRTIAEGFMAVGDAAGQVKPTSGGGIYPGLVSAKIAGRVAAQAVQEGDCSMRRLEEYESSWRAAVGRELEIGMKLNELLSGMSDDELDEVIGYLGRKPSLLRVVEEHGDIDRPSVLLAKILPHVGLDGIKLAGMLSRAILQG